MSFSSFFRTRKNKKTIKKKNMINLTRHSKKGILKRIKLREIGGQFPNYDNMIFTILIESCAKIPEHENEIGRCKIKWLHVPKKCCKWNIPISWDTMSRIKSNVYDFWFLGDADYEVIFLDK